MLSQWHIAGEPFTVNTSAGVYVSVHLRVMCENVQPLVLRLPGVHCFQGQLSKSVCSYFSFCYVLLKCRYHSDLFSF
jgi:hypothetical protein